jgi:hypothetical protein
MDNKDLQDLLVRQNAPLKVGIFDVHKISPGEFGGRSGGLHRFAA